MFGLLRVHTHLPHDEYSAFRLNYCGTCKTIGTLFGHQHRALLNSDAVFLSELLAAVSDEQQDFVHIEPYRCLRLPEREELIPPFLQYAASVTLLLAHYKILDNLEDSKHRYLWALLGKVNRAGAAKARQHLADCGLPIALIDATIAKQFQQERDHAHFDILSDAIKHYASPTATVTGLVFEYGLRTIRDSQSLAAAFAAIGTCFGTLVYLMDAIADVHEDRKNGSFNLLLHYGDLDAPHKLREMRALVRERLNELVGHIERLPVPGPRKAAFVTTLTANVG